MTTMDDRIDHWLCDAHAMEHMDVASYRMLVAACDASGDQAKR